MSIELGYTAMLEQANLFHSSQFLMDLTSSVDCREQLLSLLSPSLLVAVLSASVGGKDSAMLRRHVCCVSQTCTSQVEPEAHDVVEHSNGSVATAAPTSSPPAGKLSLAGLAAPVAADLLMCNDNLKTVSQPVPVFSGCLARDTREQLCQELR